MATGKIKTYEELYAAIDKQYGKDLIPLTGLINQPYNFTDEKKGVRLKPIYGYPDSLAYPQLQITKDGKLNFFNFPIRQVNGVNYWDSAEAWNKIDYQAAYGGRPQWLVESGSEYLYDKIVGDANSGSHKANTNAPTFPINHPGTFVGIPVLPVDYVLIQEWIGRGQPTQTKDEIGDTSDVSPAWWWSPFTKQKVVSQGGIFFYAALNTDDLITLNAQQYIVTMMQDPYSMYIKVPYGANYNQVYLTICRGTKRDNAMRVFLNAVNFLIAPTGSKSFWETAAQWAPLIAGAIVGIVVSVVSFGSATPLVAAAGAALLAYGKKSLAESTAEANALIAQAAKYNQITNLDKLAVQDIEEGGTYQSASEGRAKRKSTAIIIVLIILALAVGFYLYKKGKLKIPKT